MQTSLVGNPGTAIALTPVMEPTDKFESLARECGDALLVVRRYIIEGTHEDPEIAMARLGDWCVMLAKEDDIPETRKRQPSKTRRFIIMHAPTGLKLGPTLTKWDAFATLVKLGPIDGSTRESIQANIGEIYNAFPPGLTGSIPSPGNACSIRSDYDRCLNREAIA